MMKHPITSPSSASGKLLPARKKSASGLVCAVGALLAIHVVLAFLGVLGRSVTADETGHLTAGYAYWRFGDFRLQPENGNLPQRWGALPLLVVQPQLDPASDRENWAASRVWNVAQRFLFETGNNTDFLLLCARATMLFWSVLAGLLVFAWARLLWGNAGGIGALALFAVSPTTLAHGPLVTSDMCAAVCLLASLGSWWKMCQRPTFGAIAIAGLALGLAFVAKFSAILLLPVLATMAVFALISANGTHGTSRRQLSKAFLFAGVIAYTLIWAFFDFRFKAAASAAGDFHQFYLSWDTLLGGGGLWTDLVRAARHIHLLPEAVLYGLSFVVYFSAERGAFLAGNYSTTGWWWFFPFAFLVKSTIGELLITTTVAVRGCASMRKPGALERKTILGSALVPLILFGIVFGATSVSSNLNIGQRHILPLYLVGFILAGAVFSSRSIKALRVTGIIAIAVGALETVSAYPHYLAFFNRIAGGSQNGWRLLVDSSLDWGQDVAPLSRWIQREVEPGETIYVSSFGTADPDYEGINGQLLSPYYSLGKTRNWFELEPGLYCISATMLQDVYGIRPGPWSMTLEKDYQYLKAAAPENIENGNWSTRLPNVGHHAEHPLWLLDRLRFARLCHYLRTRRPDAVVNHTQFVFRLSAEELEVFAEKPYSALARRIQANIEYSN